MRTGLLQAQIARYTPRVVIAAALIFALVWVLFAAHNAAIHEAGTFVRASLDGITLAGLLFVVASGFTLIFGLMRVVNMAHGAFFLLGGYFALELQRNFVGGASGFGLLSSQVNFANWVLPLLIASACIAVIGLVTQQVFLRWNQGQDLRQALITIAISIILADQMLAHFGGIAEDIAWPRTLDKFVSVRVSWGLGLLLPTLVCAAAALGVQGLLRYRRGLPREPAFFLHVHRGGWGDRLQVLATVLVAFCLVDVVFAYWLDGLGDALGGVRPVVVAGVFYSVTRFFILGLAIAIGATLWFWLKRTRTGMIIRAGVDDRAMVSALGINIQLVFAVAFMVGSALAGLGGVVGGSFASLAPGVDANWLLNSLVVVIIGGMGSLGGAAIGALLYGLVTTLSATYLPQNYSFYSIIFTFVLLALVLAVRPLGLFGRPA